jgi:hypothetical protein
MINIIKMIFITNTYLTKPSYPGLFPTPDESKQADQAYARPILGYSTLMRVHIYSPRPKLVNLDEIKKLQKPTLTLSQVTQMRVKIHLPYPGLFNPAESKYALTLSWVIQSR